jgi:hypothetical protein
MSIGAFVGAALIGVGYLQYRVYTRQAGIMNTQTNISQNEFFTLHPPILKVENVAIWQKGKEPKGAPPPILDDKAGIVGQVLIYNGGDTDAMIDQASFIADWYDSLPMRNPFDDNIPTGGFVNRIDQAITITKLGPVEFGAFDINVRPREGNKTLFAFGFIVFIDQRKIGPNQTKPKHILHFAFKYNADPAVQHFERVTDRPDYDDEH